MKCKLILLLTILFLAMGCNGPRAYYSLGGIFDVNKDDGKILCSVSAGISSSIYQIDTNGVNLKVLVSATDTTSVGCPRYNLACDKILYISSSLDTNKRNSIYIASADGSNRELLLQDSGYITEAFFSRFSNKVYYCMASHYGNSSPIASSGMHGMDIYSINIADKKITQVTNFNAYSINRVSEKDSITLFMDMPDMENSGMVSLSLDDPSEIERFQPKNNPRESPNMYYTPRYDQLNQTIGFIAPYELYLMDKHDKNAILIAGNTGNLVQNFMFFKTKKELLFTRDNELCFYRIGFDGKDLKKIFLPFEEPAKGN